MKIQTSRESHRADQRYAGVYQQQGRMITDADWNELMEIVTQRRREALGDVVQSGIPRDGGLGISLSGAGEVMITPGHLYAGGTLARLPGAAAFSYADQPDFPAAPALPTSPDEFVLYADVWERTLTALHQPDLRDAALHGADTCARTQTVVQIKWCPGSLDPEDEATNPARGNAPLTLTLRRTRATDDPCDPCTTAELGEDPSRVGNYLFRVEVHDTTWDAAAGEVNRLTLKWSTENGAEQYAVGTEPAGFRGDDWAYEFFGDTTEKHLGVHLATATGFPRRGLLSAGFPDTVPDGYANVRRWDGFVTLDRSAGGWELADEQAVDRGRSLSLTGDPSADGFVTINSEFTVNLRGVVLRVALDDRVFVAGDYWTTPVREEIHAVGDVVLPAAPPTGIVHHYLALGRVEFPTGGEPPIQIAPPPDDAARRRLEFPSLTTIQASDVGLANSCPGLYGDAENVQQALDQLCDIDATDVAYDVPDCPADPTDPPTVQSLLRAALGTQWPDDDADGRDTVADVLNALLCKLNAAAVPYDPTVRQERWDDVIEAEEPDAPPQPSTVQEALDTLIENLESGDIGYRVPTCASGPGEPPRLRELLGLAAGSSTNVKALWDEVLCRLSAATVPVDKEPPLAPPLNVPAVRTVQDALNALAGRGGKGGLAGVLAELANAVGIIPDDPRRAALRDAPVTGEGSLAESTVGLVLDALRILAALYLEFLDLKGSVTTPDGDVRVGTSASLNLLASIRPDARALAVDQINGRRELWRELSARLQDTAWCVLAEFLEDHGVSREAMERFGQQYGDPSGYNGPALRLEFLRTVYAPLLGSTDLDHTTLARLRKLVLELVGRLWRRLATDLLILDPPSLTPCPPEHQWLQGERVLRALSRVGEPDGLLRFFPDTGGAVPPPAPRLVIDREDPGATWLVRTDSLERYDHTGIIRALERGTMRVGRRCPDPNVVIRFKAPATVLHTAAAWWEQGKHGVLEIVFLNAEGRTEALLVPIPELPTGGETIAAPDQLPALRRGPIPPDAVMVTGDGRHLPVVHRRMLSPLGRLDEFLVTDVSRRLEVRATRPGARVLAAYNLSIDAKPAPSHVLLVEEESGRQQLVLIGSDGERPWWRSAGLKPLAHTALHQGLEVVGVAHDQIVLQVTRPMTSDDDGLWTFLPMRTLRTELWGAGTERDRFQAFWETKHPDGAPLFESLDGSVPEPTEATGAPPLPLSPGVVRRTGPAGIEGWLSLLAEDEILELYQCYRDLLPAAARRYHVGRARSALGTVVKAGIVIGDAREDAVEFELGSVKE